MLSAYIRLAEVGIGCQDWPQCYARLDPAAEQQGIAVLTEQGREMAHYGARVAHRYIASVLGLFIVIIFALALRQGKHRATGLPVPLAIFAITVFLSLLGYYTPTRSNPLITMGNLLGGMALLGLLWWLLQRETEAAEVPPPPPGLRGPAVLALLLVLSQIVLGGWSSANYSSASCLDLLSCEGDILSATGAAEVFDPGRRIALDEAGKVIRSDSLGLLSMTHRLFGLLTAAYLAWLVRRLKPRPLPAGSALAMAVFSIGQILAGVSTVWLGMPLLLLTAHNALAAGLLLCSVNVLHRLTPPATSAPPG